MNRDKEYERAHPLWIEYHELIKEINEGTIPETKIIRVFLDFNIKLLTAILNKEIPSEEIKETNIFLDLLLPKYQKVLMKKFHNKDIYETLYEVFESPSKPMSKKENLEEAEIMLKEAKKLKQLF